MPCSMVIGWRISSGVAMMKRSWMVWENNGSRIGTPVEILHDALIRTLFWSSWKRSMRPASGWKEQPRGFLAQAFIDTDGTMAPTLGECKGGMALSYKGIWGYAPLIISLANSREVLYLVNRPGNVVSHEGCVPWIDRAIDLVRPHAGEITLRGDSDFTLSAQLDRWDSQGIKFIFGMDAHPKVVQLAEALPAEAWKPLERLARYEIATEPRRKAHRIKEAIVRFKGYPNKKLIGEAVAEFDYQPLKCGRSYRLVVVRKNISVQKGELVLFEEIKYFFY